MILFLWAKHVFPMKIYCQLTVYGHSIMTVQLCQTMAHTVKNKQMSMMMIVLASPAQGHMYAPCIHELVLKNHVNI